MKKALKIIGYIVIVALLAIMVYYAIPFAKLLYTEEGRALIDQKVNSFGTFAPLAFIGIEILQIVAAFIPGAPIEVMSGVLFGSVWGVIWCFIGVFIGTVIVFYLVRKFGKPLVFKLFPKEKLENMKLLNDEKRLTLTIFILFVIPGTPKDFLTYIAGLTDIKPMKFFFTAAIARTPSMACSVFMGANLGKGRFLISFIMFAVIILMSVTGYFIKKKFIDKTDSSKTSNATK